MTALRLRRAIGDDVDFVVGLLNEEDTAPFLAASRSRDRAGVLEDVKASTEEPGDCGLFVIEVPDGGGWARAGMMEFSLENRRAGSRAWADSRSIPSSMTAGSQTRRRAYSNAT